jgi:hypothetical protein
VYIYIDESGPFAAVPPSRAHRISAVAALVIPDTQHDRLISEYERLEQSWGGGAEPKGSQLQEEQISSVIELASRYDVLFDAVAIDMALQRDADTSEFKADQAARIMKAVTPLTPPEGLQYYRDLARACGLSNPLFIQAYLTISLIERLLKTATLFYALRIPTELATFRWVVDAKEIGGTEYERLWRALILPLTQWTSIREPFTMIEGGNYSHFERFRVDTASLPEHLKPCARGRGGMNLGLILGEHFTLGESALTPGLRLVDILASAFTRALNATLGQRGWRGLGRLMITRDCATIKFTRLKVDGLSFSLNAAPYAGVVHEWVAETKSMFPGYSRWADR